MTDDPTGGQDRPGRLDVGIVSAGRAGSVLGAAMAIAGHRLVGVTARSEASRERAAVLLPDVPVLPAADVAAEAQLLLLAVPDDVLPGLVAELADSGAIRPGQVVVHVCGRHGTDVLEPAAARGALTLAVHPAMTFTGTSLDLRRLPGCPTAVTAAPALLPLAQAVAIDLGGEPVVVAAADRALYHAALSHGANHLVTLVGQAARMLEEAGVSEPGDYLRPLLEAALGNALAAGESALTGPVARGDAATVRAHTAALGELDQPSQADLLATYAHLARTTAARAVRTGRLAPDAAAAVLDALP
ncbi:Rossmann-like and DUF2520 domain-containing protein [Georgenia sp. Z1344]|uniref:Rossmann-like and DUF2520 domain-containing protein n=1 Tax=Georgenia sp. Z1344 TaxID=3416706 RepID=UPI003CF9A1CE